MKKKIIIAIVIALVFIVAIVGLSGIGNTENIKNFKKGEFVYLLEETGYTWDEATKKVMSNVKWEEYEKNGHEYIKISGTEKSTKKKIEIIYKHYEGEGWSRDLVTIDGNSNDTYLAILFKDIL